MKPLGLFALLLALVGCAASHGVPSRNKANVSSESSARDAPSIAPWRSDLFGRRWRVLSFADAEGTVSAEREGGREPVWIELGPGGARGHSFLNGFWHYFRYCRDGRLTHADGSIQLLGGTPEEEALDSRFFRAVGAVRRYVRSKDHLELRSEEGGIVIQLQVDPNRTVIGSRGDDDNPTSPGYVPPPCP